LKDGLCLIKKTAIQKQVFNNNSRKIYNAGFACKFFSIDVYQQFISYSACFALNLPFIPKSQRHVGSVCRVTKKISG
jgi:hypothetical protein